MTKQGGSFKLIFRTPLKLKEHLYPEKYPIPLLDPITPFWRVQKLQRKEKNLGIEISYPKPKWLIEQESKPAEKKEEKETFIYPVPIMQNSGKIRKRKPPVYKKINYNLPWSTNYQLSTKINFFFKLLIKVVLIMSFFLKGDFKIQESWEPKPPSRSSNSRNKGTEVEKNKSLVNVAKNILA